MPDSDQDKTKNTKPSPSSSPKEGLDYYIENGFLVMTEYYLKNRGYCCENGCRHCPYGFEKKEE